MKLTAFLFFVLCYHSLSAQMPLIPIDIRSGIAAGSINYTVTDFDIGTVSAMFDNNPMTIARTPDINPMVLTMELPQLMSIKNIELFQLQAGHWKLETAQSISDLENTSGTYKLQFEDVASPARNWTAQTLTSSVFKVLRITVHRTECCDGYVHIGEIRLNQEAVSISLAPNNPKLMPGSTYQMVIVGKDIIGNEQPISNQNAVWNSSNSAIASVSNTGMLTAGTNGVCRIMASVNGITAEALLSVQPILIRPLASSRVVKVALVLQDPPIPSFNNETFSRHFGWLDPLSLARALRDSLTAASSGVVQYQIVQFYNDTTLFTRMGNNLLSRNRMAQLLAEPGWTTLRTNGTKFDYNMMLEHYNFCTQSNDNQIDEVWVYAPPYGGLWESTLTGTGAFTVNSPPLTGNSCIDHLTVMGLNYERGLDAALHSYGHRVESVMSYVYGRWDRNIEPFNNWEHFASGYYSRHTIPQINMGNIHYPPNTGQEYDYVSNNNIISYADSWLHYPFLSNEHRTINCQEWQCNELGFMMWWLRHLPKFDCTDNTGVLNNWWAYIVDYNEGNIAARSNSLSGCYKCSCKYP